MEDAYQMMTWAMIVITICAAVNVLCWVALLLAAARLRRDLKKQSESVRRRAEQVRQDVEEKKASIDRGARRTAHRFRP